MSSLAQMSQSRLGPAWPVESIPASNTLSSALPSELCQSQWGFVGFLVNTQNHAGHGGVG